MIDSLHWEEELNIALKNKYYIVIIHSSSMNKTSFVPENSSRNHKKNSNSDLTQLQSAHFIYPSILHLITPTRIVTKFLKATLSLLSSKLILLKSNDHLASFHLASCVLICSILYSLLFPPLLFSPVLFSTLTALIQANSNASFMR